MVTDGNWTYHGDHFVSQATSTFQLTPWLVPFPVITSISASLMPDTQPELKGVWGMSECTMLITHCRITARWKSVPFLTKVLCCNQSYYFFFLTKANWCEGFSLKHIVTYHFSIIKETNRISAFLWWHQMTDGLWPLRGSAPTPSSPPLAASVYS